MKSVAIIGAGPGGICAAIKLKQRGYTNFTIFEQADGVGGTWRHNTYPGCRCDVPSSLYSFSFAINLDWSERFASQPEILCYLENVAEEFGILPHAEFNIALTAARWNGATAQWDLSFSDGSVRPFDVVISAVGMFNLPKIPDISGLGSFNGAIMHSARWDHDVDLKGRRIAVIGSAASAVQIVPEIAMSAEHVDVYQRSPNHVRPRGEYSDEERHEIIGNRAEMLRDREVNLDWIDAIATLSDPQMIEESDAICEANLAQVEDPLVREYLRPNYPFGSKRPLVSSDWYPAFNRENVELVTAPVHHVDLHAIVTADGRSRKADVIILATGFQTTRFLSVVPVQGVNDKNLSECWEDGASAYKGITVPGFPNLFMLYGPNTNNGSIIFNIEVQVEYALRHIERMDSAGLGWIDVREDAWLSYNQELQRDIARIAPWQGATSNYYRTESGLNVTQWPHGMRRYADVVLAADYDAYESAAFTGRGAFAVTQSIEAQSRHGALLSEEAPR